MSSSGPITGGFFDPDWDGDDDHEDPIVAPGIYYRQGYADATQGWLEKRQDIPEDFQGNYDQGWDEGKWRILAAPGVN